MSTSMGIVDSYPFNFTNEVMDSVLQKSSKYKHANSHIRGQHHATPVRGLHAPPAPLIYTGMGLQYYLCDYA